MTDALGSSSPLSTPAPAPTPPAAVPSAPASTGTSQPAAGAPASPAAPQPPANAATPPAGAEERHKFGDLELTAAEIKDLAADKAQRDLRAATLPASPDAYELRLSENAVLPGGMNFEFNANDPGLIAARNWAHAKGIDQSTFSEMLTLYATQQTMQENNLREMQRAELGKVGPNAPQRVAAVTKWLRAEVGDADARPIVATLVTDAHLRFYEKIMTRIVSQGVPAFSQAHRDTPDNTQISGWATMSFEQRRAAQDNARRGSR